MTVRAYKLGALGQDDLTGVKCLAATTAAGSRYMTFETPVGTDYQVTSGATFYITQIDITCVTLAPVVTIGYGNDGVGDGAAAPTSYVAMTSGLRDKNDYSISLSVLIPIPSLKYPCVYVAGQAANVTVYGIEVL